MDSWWIALAVSLLVLATAAADNLGKALLHSLKDFKSSNPGLNVDELAGDGLMMDRPLGTARSDEIASRRARVVFPKYALTACTKIVGVIYYALRDVILRSDFEGGVIIKPLIPV